MKLAPFKAIIFDCDGVLVDSEILGLRSLRQAIQEAGVECSLESLTRFSGRSHAETLAILERESGVALDSSGIATRMDECYRCFVETEGLETCAGIRELLSALSELRMPFTLASSGPRAKVCFSLASARLTSLFPSYICGDDVARAKPAPDIYLAAATLIGMEPTDCLAVEDSPNGLRAALSAGMQVAAITTTFASKDLADATIVIDSHSELLRQIAEFRVGTFAPH